MSVPEEQLLINPPDGEPPSDDFSDDEIFEELRRRGLDNALEDPERVDLDAAFPAPPPIDDASIFSEIVSRGLIDELDDDAREYVEELQQKGVIHIPQTGSFDLGTDEGISGMQKLLNIDPNVSQRGVQDIPLRAEISKGDTPQEQESRLSELVGPDGFTRDRFGNLALTPKGAERRGITTDIPIRIDERFLSTGDIGDLRGVAAPIAGAVAAGVATGGVGALPAIAATGLGAAGGKAYDEIIESIVGKNQQGPLEVAQDLAIEGGAAMGGEAVFRGILAPLGRKILAPNQPATRFGTSKVSPEARKVVDDARAIGVIPNITNVQDRMIINRFAGMVETILGDPNVARNIGAIKSEMKRLGDMFRVGTQRTVDEIDFAALGEGTRAAVVKARKLFGDAARREFALVDQILKGREIVPTGQLKAQARELLRALPRQERVVDVPAGAIQGAPGGSARFSGARGSTGDPLIPASTAKVPGKVALTSRERVKDLMDIDSLPDFITVEQLQGLRNTLRDRLDFGNITPGIGHREASKLLRSADGALDDAVEQLPSQIAGPDDLVLVQSGLQQLKSARDFYREGIQKFKNATIARISREPGDYLPESIIDEVFIAGKATAMKRIMAVVPEEQGNAIRAGAMEKILEKAMRESADPLEGFDFDGLALEKALNSFGPTIKETFGEQGAANLRRLASVIQVAKRQKGKTSGALVAATVALRAVTRPISTFLTMTRLRIMSKIFTSENGQKWLIEGFEAKNAREATAAISRLATQIKWLSERETGVPAQSIGVSFQDRGVE